MTLSDRVTISGKFLRSTRIDVDSSLSSMEGFVFPASLKELLRRMGEQEADSNQAAYTWTGPYGSGKSSLAMVFNQLIGGNKKQRDAAAKFVKDEKFVEQLTTYFAPQKNGWTFLNIVGELNEPHRTVARRLVESGLAELDDNADEMAVIDALINIAKANPKSTGGLFLVIDEMGKFLEHSASGSNDIYFFQQLAEKASRCGGRLIVVGILHQAFQEYANKLGRSIRDEWAKIQGRFADIPVNISGEEQLTLIANAIETDAVPKGIEKLSNETANLLKASNISISQDVASTLAGVWPLHPITALLLGPLSKKSYGQNQRSIFTFLSAAEGAGFQDFLKNASGDDLYRPSNLWDYLLQNLQSSIAVSADSHHFSNAKEALDLSAASGGADLEEQILKTIALIELTRQQSGIGASEEAIVLACNNHSTKSVKAALASLMKKSVIVFRQYRGTYGLFEGSDFDMEAALDEANREVARPDLSAIGDAIGITAISAKRHYHQTGTMRWCDFMVLPADQVKETVEKRVGSLAFGTAILALPTNEESVENLLLDLQKIQKSQKNQELLLATSYEGTRLVSLAKEHTLLNYILDNRQEIDRDKIARREIKDRLDAITNLINREIWSVMNSALWITKKQDVQKLSWPQLNSTISDMAANKFNKSPIIHNELLNRRVPSGSANAALKGLLHAMVLREVDEQLGFVKYPAEKGLYCSIIEANGLHQKSGKSYRFVSPLEIKGNTFRPIWEATREYLDNHSDRSVPLQELYNLWRQEPFGVADGLMPLIAVLFLITERSSLAFYREGIFLSKFTDIDVDYLLRAPELIKVRLMNMSELSRRLLSNMADVAAEVSGQPVLNLESLDVARSLIAAFEKAAPWVHRTSKLSQNAIQIRALFKRSTDPNKFLFDDIPALYADKVDITSQDGNEYITQHIKDGLSEILGRYPLMLHKLRDQVLHELQVPSLAPQAIAELNARAETIKGITGDMRLEAFIGRLAQFENDDDAIERLVSLGINKPAKGWVDSDIDRAAVALINFAQQFNKHETVARVDGRKSKRDAMAVVVGMDGRPVPIIQEFDVLESERDQVDTVASDLQKTLNKYSGLPQNVALAALATVSASVIGSDDVSEDGEAFNV